MQIEIESQMRSAARDGVDGYQPIFRGQPLEVEAAIPEVSLKNLRILLKAGLQVASMIAVESGHILVVFKTGETYLATGFAVGEASDLTKAFAQFASEAFPGSRREWENQIIHFYAPDYQGLINPARTPIAGPRVFKP